MRKKGFSTKVKDPYCEGLFAIYQSYQKGNAYLKAILTPEFDLPAIFLTKDGARTYLGKVLKDIKDDIKLGGRQKDALDPKKGLDFCILPITLFGDVTVFQKRGWKIK